MVVLTVTKMVEKKVDHLAPDLVLHLVCQKEWSWVGRMVSLKVQKKADKKEECSAEKTVCMTAVWMAMI